MARQNDLVARFSETNKFGQLAFGICNRNTHERNMDYLVVHIKKEGAFQSTDLSISRSASAIAGGVPTCSQMPSRRRP